MATTNVTVDHTWTRVASVSSDLALISCKVPALVEFATTANDVTAPIVDGHAVQTPGMQMSRSIIGSGSIWAKIVSGSPDQTTFVVNEE